MTLDQLLRATLQERRVAAAEIAPPAVSAGAAMLRRYPFPFLCALGIMDDTRGVTAEAFADVRAAFATRGLELGACASFDPADHIFVGGAAARALNDAGLLDGVAGLPPKGAEEGAALLAEAGLSPLAFAGGAPIAPAAPLAAAGVRYFTDDGFSARARFGTQYRVRTAGEVQAALSLANFDRFGLHGSAQATDLAAHAAALPAPDRRELLFALWNRPLFGIGGLTAFRRFAGLEAPSAPTLPLQLRTSFLIELEAQGGLAIVQQRLGDFALIGQAAAHEQRRPAQVPVLDLHAAVALDELADLSRERVLVAAASRLLGWADLTASLALECREAESGWTITVTPTRADLALDLAALEGLAICVPEGAPMVTVRAAGIAAPLAMERVPDPANPGMDCLTLPWRSRA